MNEGSFLRIAIASTVLIGVWALTSNYWGGLAFGFAALFTLRYFRGRNY